MSDLVASRRLAAIVSIDVAGYSAMAETDETAAVALVADLAARVTHAARVEGGRVFNSAGDGFMLEFPTVSGALAAADTIRGQPGPPVRIGVNLGEIAVTATGDLLGHGVNVAARLQALARPGEVLVAADAGRALRGPLSQRLGARKRVRLEKMGETVEVFSLASTPKPPPRPRRPIPYRAMVAAFAVVLPIGGLFVSLTAWRRDSQAARGPQGFITAVLAIASPPNDTGARTLADNLESGIAAGLAERQAPTASREAAHARGHGGARLLVNGAVERVGDTLRVRLTLDDARSNRSVWANTLEQPASEVAALQDQAANRVADVVDVAVRSFSGVKDDVDTETLGAFLKLAELARLGRAGGSQSVALARQVVQAAPNASRGRSSLAYALASSIVDPGSDTGRGLAKAAAAEANRALALDANNGEAYMALLNIAPRGDRRRRLKLLQDGLRAEPQNFNLMFALADLYREVGRIRDALPLYRMSLALDPSSPPRNAGEIFVLSATGATPEAEALARQAMRLWPERITVRRAALNSAMLYSAPATALATLDAYQASQHRFTPEGAEAWRGFAKARQAGRFTPQVLSRLRQAALARQIDLSNAIAALAMGGDLDGAFALCDFALKEQDPFYTAVLFERAAAPMRKDPRFFELVQRLDILRFWRGGARWADFCTDPAEKIDCEAEAQRVYPSNRRMVEDGRRGDDRSRIRTATPPD